MKEPNDVKKSKAKSLSLHLHLTYILHTSSYIHLTSYIMIMNDECMYVARAWYEYKYKYKYKGTAEQGTGVGTVQRRGTAHSTALGPRHKQIDLYYVVL